AEDGIRDFHVTGVQTCAHPICHTTPPHTRLRRRSTPFQPVSTSLPTPSRGPCLTSHADFPSHVLRTGAPTSHAMPYASQPLDVRSEERRIGHECRARATATHKK